MRSADELLRAARRIDPGRVRAGLAVGLRDAALLALVASGVRASLIAGLMASQIGRHPSGCLEITAPGDDGWERRKVLPPVASALVLAWLAEARTWGIAVPAFYTVDRLGNSRPLTVKAVHGVLERERQRGRKRA